MVTPNKKLLSSLSALLFLFHSVSLPPQGIHVVTPNKKLNSGPLAEYLAVKQLQRQGKAHYMYEVCALGWI